MVFKVKTIALAFTLALVGCGGGNGSSSSSSSGTGGDNLGGNSNGNTSCASITGGGTKVTTNTDAGCANCSISNASSAADGDLNTYATLSVNNAAPMQGASVRATAQAGIVYPSGQTAGAFVSVPAGSGQSYTVTVKTYLSGVLQESNSGDNSGGVDGVQGGHKSSFDGVKTTKQFDAVEVLINNNQAGGTPSFGVYEICSSHN